MIRYFNLITGIVYSHPLTATNEYQAFDCPDWVQAISPKFHSGKQLIPSLWVISLRGVRYKKGVSFFDQQVHKLIVYDSLEEKARAWDLLRQLDEENTPQIQTLHGYISI